MTLKNFVARFCIVAMVAGTMLAGTAEAKPKKNRINGRRANQQKRIGKGLESGQLTAREAQRLEKGEGKINRDIKKARADGKVTAKEHRKIEREQDRESKRIYKEKHDGQTRDGKPGATPATPADPGAPGNGATPATPATPPGQ